MSSEIQILLQKAKESLEAAEMLERGGYTGFSASRAYYSMFYIAEVISNKENKGNEPKTQSFFKL